MCESSRFAFLTSRSARMYQVSQQSQLTEVVDRVLCGPHARVCVPLLISYTLPHFAHDSSGGRNDTRSTHQLPLPDLSPPQHPAPTVLSLRQSVSRHRSGLCSSSPFPSSVAVPPASAVAEQTWWRNQRTQESCGCLALHEQDLVESWRKLLGAGARQQPYSEDPGAGATGRYVTAAMSRTFPRYCFVHKHSRQSYIKAEIGA